MTDAFPDPLDFRDAGMRGGSRVFALSHRFRYFSSYGCVTVPRGFETDGASIPRVFWNVLAPYGEYFHAAVIHDFLYSGYNSEFNRLEADTIFNEAMKACGVPWPRRMLIYRAVRSFGWRCFKGTTTK